MRVVEICCGAGGMSLGLQRASLNIVAAYDKWSTALAVYRDNFPPEQRPALLRPFGISRREHHAANGDLGELSGLAPLIMRLPIDMIAGGPPCQGFSRLGHQVEGARANGSRSSLV